MQVFVPRPINVSVKVEQKNGKVRVTQKHFFFCLGTNLSNKKQKHFFIDYIDDEIVALINISTGESQKLNKTMNRLDDE